MVIELVADDEAVEHALADACEELGVDHTPARHRHGDLLGGGPTVVRYPARILKGIAGPVGAIGDRGAAAAEDLVDTMYDSPGCVGLAAPQLGVASAPSRWTSR
jgi:hypothetical protein